jgi:hypothetical protein
VLFEKTKTTKSKLPTPEELKAGLSYTECVLKETLRLHRHVALIVRGGAELRRFGALFV